ncbi:MAG: choice-of-anchor D domain-containing protein [Terriglobales bacterium]
MIRRMTVALLAVTALVLGVSVVCQAEPQALMTRHVREAVINGQAQLLGRLPASQSLRFDVVLPLRHEPELDNFLEELYDPSSLVYRQFVTAEEFTERFGPSQEDYDALIRFAEANGLTVVGGSRDEMDVQFKAPVSAVEKAFHVTMGLYQHPTENRTFYAPDREPTVDLPFQLWHISGLDNYSIPHPLARHSDTTVKSNISGSCPGNSYCGSDMRAAYYGGTSLTGSGQTLGLLEYYGYDITDFDTYFKNVGQTNKVTINGISTDGSSLTCLVTKGCDDTEQIIDMVQAVSMAPGMKALNVYVGATDSALFGKMSKHSPLDAQLSSSWTWEPSDPSTADPFLKRFASQGQSYFQAAGDNGAYNRDSSYVFPADDPYVISVGGTDLLTTKAGGPWASETAWTYGGGGYYTPDAFPIPSWQQLKGVINSANKGSTTLRNSPDVSAEANNDFYACADQGACQTGWGGTSFAAPMWAGFMALVNQQAAAGGAKTVGFINPLIYPLGVSSGYGAAFHDITSGNNGYPAVTGYDLATGWGSPNGAGLIKALAASQSVGAAATLSPSSLAWEQTVVGETAPAEKTVTVTNSGSATLNISSIVASGDFAVTQIANSCGSTLAEGDHCVIKVTFTPTQLGTRTGAITISDNASGSPQTVPLSGTGSAQATLTPVSRMFPAEKVGTGSPAWSFTLSNKQDVALTGISKKTTGDFSISATTCSSTLAAKSDCTFSVVFKPTQTGTRTGTLQVSDSAVGGPQTSSLTGTGK